MTIEEIIKKFHWAQIGDDGVLELYLDHHALSTYRMCEAKFQLEIVESCRAKGQQPWSLSFGTVFHKCVEYIYKTKADETFNYSVLLDYARIEWMLAKLDNYKEHKTYIALGGFEGFITLIASYANFYSAEAERLRPIGVELAFGKGKEVFLGEITIWNTLHGDPHFTIARCYLSGRIDFLMDSGTAIGPMDHKTKAFFKGNPAEDHDPQEGMTGYIFAAKHILQNKFPELLAKRKVDRIWMNYVQVKAEPDFNKRFKRIPIFKTEWQLEQYRLRQLSTFGKILELLTSGRAADWNTSVCSNTYHQDCAFKHLHKKNNKADMFRILENDFYVAPEWNPDKMEERDNAQVQSGV